MRGAARGAKPAPLLTALGLIGLLLCAVAPAAASEFLFKPSLALIEEYNDNIYETPVHTRHDWVTRVQPGAGIHYDSTLMNVDMAYLLDFRKYARASQSDEYNHDLKFHGLGKLVDNFFFLEVNESFTRVPLDVARDTTKESLNANQTDQNELSVSPFLLWRLGEKCILKTGYLLGDTRYSDGSGPVSSSGIDKREQGGFVNLSHELSARVNLLARYSYRHVKTGLIRYDQNDVSGGFKYQYADKGSFSGSIGNSWQNFSVGGSTSNLIWSVGLLHDFDRFIVGLDAVALFVEDPRSVSMRQTTCSGKVEMPVSHGSVGINGSYSEYLRTLTGIMDRRQTAAGVNTRLELLPKVTTTIAVSGDHLSGPNIGDYPYHMTGTAALAYACNYDITLGLTYTYAIYRLQWDSSALAKKINRVAFELRKAF